MTIQIDGVVPQASFQRRLELAMEAAGLDVDGMAAGMRCSTTTIRNYLAGRTKMNYPKTVAWAALTGVNLHWLETGQDPYMRGPGDVAGEGFEPSTSGLHGSRDYARLRVAA